MNVHTYLFFQGRCEEAIGFYQQALGAECTFMMRYHEGPPNLIFPGGENQVFHATLQFGESILNMADSAPGEHSPFAGFVLLTHVDSQEEAERAFDALSREGNVQMSLQETPWAKSYGIVKDQFGVTWKIQFNG